MRDSDRGQLTSRSTDPDLNGAVYIDEACEVEGPAFRPPFDRLHAARQAVEAVQPVRNRRMEGTTWPPFSWAMVLTNMGLMVMVETTISYSNFSELRDRVVGLTLA